GKRGKASGCWHLVGAGRQVVWFRWWLVEGYLGGGSGNSKGGVLTRNLGQLGVDHERFFTGIAQQGIKDRLKANTDELMGRGGFGSPTLYLDRDDMYFGNDRLPLLRAALERRASRLG